MRVGIDQGYAIGTFRSWCWGLQVQSWQAILTFGTMGVVKLVLMVEADEYTLDPATVRIWLA